MVSFLDFLELPAIDKWLDSVALAMLDSMMVEPNGFELNLETPPGNFKSSIQFTFELAQTEYIRHTLSAIRRRR